MRPQPIKYRLWILGGASSSAMATEPTWTCASPQQAIIFHPSVEAVSLNVCFIWLMNLKVYRDSF